MKKTIILITILTMIAMQANGQGWVKGLGQKVKETAKQSVENKVEQKAEEAVNKTLDKTEEALKKKKGGNTGKEDTESDSNDETTQIGKGNNSGQQQETRLTSTTKYDFVPGDQILFYEDFSQDAIGDFPALWTSNSSGEIKTVNISNGNWFHMNGEDVVYCYSKNIIFPANFILEFDLIPNDEYHGGLQVAIYQDDPQNIIEMNDDLYPGLGGLEIYVEYDHWATKGYVASPDKPWLEASKYSNPVEKEKMNHVIVWVQNRRVRIYYAGTKIIDSPTNLYPDIRMDKLRLKCSDNETKPYISNIKITTASPDTRSKLLAEGKIISYGINFDSGKDVVKQDSYASIKEIATVLNENPGVRIKIAGHTDSDGQDALNLDLSKRRAANVKQYLVNEFSIDASRIETDGLGETQPIAGNSTVEGKAKNRRVEFIKL